MREVSFRLMKALLNTLFKLAGETLRRIQDEIP